MPRVRARLVTLAVILALAGLSASATALADESFLDASGDMTMPGLGPDITTVQVTTAPDGLITFRVAIANYETLPLKSFVAIFFDLDRNPDTGGQGDEARVGWVPDLGLTFEKWNGTEFVAAPADALTAGFASGVFTLTIPRAELSGLTSFAFYAGALVIDGANVGIDLAPGNEMRWHYDVVASRVALSATRPVGKPARPVAGRQFSVSAVVTRSDTGAAVRAGSITCAARVGKARLRAVGRFMAGRAHCVMTVPRAAKGRTLTGTLTIRSADATITRRYSFRVV
jgi:hypothetical protein